MFPGRHVQFPVTQFLSQYRLKATNPATQDSSFLSQAAQGNSDISPVREGRLKNRVRFDQLPRQVLVPIKRLITHYQDLLKRRSRWTEILFDLEGQRIVIVLLHAPEKDRPGRRPMLMGSMDQHRDQQAGQQQQCHEQENNHHFACIPGGVMVMPLFHKTFLSQVESWQALLQHRVKTASEDWQTVKEAKHTCAAGSSLHPVTSKMKRIGTPGNS
jgi:hypothetical protein